MALKICLLVISFFWLLGVVSVIVAGVTMVRGKVEKKELFQAVSDGLTTILVVAFLFLVAVMSIVVFWK